MISVVKNLTPYSAVNSNLFLKKETINFPGGEIGVRLNVDDLNYRYDPTNHHTIIAKLISAEEIVQLAMVKDALVRLQNIPVKLFLPYCPYARQDRVCNPGESFSLKVFASLINSMGFDQVTIVDPHSDVVMGVFDRVEIISQMDVIHNFAALSNNVLMKNVHVVSPDAGANKKTAEAAKYLGLSNFVRADKKRDLATGKILETIVYDDCFNKQDVLIIDDICDGGRTFIELAKVLKQKDAGRVMLYVTHGIFSKGIEILFESGIDEIYCTNSYRDDYDVRVKLFKLEQYFYKNL